MVEIWKDVKDFPGYQISNLGRVKSFKKNRKLILSTRKNEKGYYIVNLYKNNKVMTKKIHRLVATEFIKNQNNKPQVNHKDGDKTNNVVDNLEWCTAKENTIHAINSGLNKLTGVYNYINTLKIPIIIEINKNKYVFESLSEASRKLMINKSSISDWLNKKHTSNKNIKVYYKEN